MKIMENKVYKFKIFNFNFGEYICFALSLFGCITNFISKDNANDYGAGLWAFNCMMWIVFTSWERNKREYFAKITEDAIYDIRNVISSVEKKREDEKDNETKSE